MKILIIEDEKKLLDNISQYLSSHNYICETVSDFQIADEKIAVNEYDCIIVDIMLPDGNGLDLINTLKKNKDDTGIIIISAKNSLEDKLIGLDLGADDYLTKPFHLSELNARVKAVLRRKGNKGFSVIEFNEIKIDLDLNTVKINDESIVLTTKEFQLLVFLIMNKGKIIRKQSLVEHLWPDDYDFNSYDFIYTHLTNIRKKMIKVGCKDYIKTVYGIGYKFSEE